MPDLNFETQLDQFMNEFTEQAANFAPAIAEQLLVDILRAGPYWSGRSKASWTLSLGSPMTIEAVDVPKRAGGISEEEAEQTSLATMANLANFRLGEVIYLTQGTAYLEYIETGANQGSQHVGFVAEVLSRYEGLVSMEVSL
jgi:hypothetical protein